MDLDDILNKAENHDTEASAEAVGASLGGENFLNQFAAIQDVKNDLSWEDIIPEHARAKIEEEVAQAAAEKSVDLSGKRRAAAPAPGAYEGMDGDDKPSSDKAKLPLKKPKPVPLAPKKAVPDKSMDLKGKTDTLLVWSIIVFTDSYYPRRSRDSWTCTWYLQMG